MKRNFTIGVLFGMLMLVFATRATASAATEVLDRIVAVVNEEIILLSELNERMEPYVQRIHQQDFSLEQERQMIYKVREEILNRLIDEKLTDQEIKRNDIQVDSAEIDNTIERIKAANSFTDEDLRSYLEQEQMTMGEYRDKIKEQVLRTRLVNYEVKSKIVVTEEDIRSYYDAHPEIYGGKIRYHLRNILMQVPAYSTDAEKSEIRRQMEDLRAQVLSGSDFAALARAHSQGPTASDGGDIGMIDKKTLSPQIQAALDGLSQGHPTEVLDTDQGYQLFFLEAIDRTQGIPLEKARDEIHQKLFTEVVDKKFLSWLEDLRSQSHIKIVH